ncbi:MAG: 5'/3'-nucleotidase SurE [Alphaproteobacteria bacterium]
MRILLVNDDGVHADGIKVLEKIARTLSDDVWVVAPETQKSGASHSLTVDAPLRVSSHGPQRFAVSGTPTDCMLIGSRHLVEGRPPDLVLSGINEGSNLGEDVSYSGTVAAAKEATLLGMRAIALSQERDSKGRLDWKAAERHAPDLIRRIITLDWGKGVLVNINFPARPPGDVKEVRIVSQGRRDLQIAIDRRTDPRGRDYFWILDRTGGTMGKGTDLAAIEQGAIAVTPLHLDHTYRPALARFRQHLNGAIT